MFWSNPRQPKTDIEDAFKDKFGSQIINPHHDFIGITSSKLHQDTIEDPDTGEFSLLTQSGLWLHADFNQGLLLRAQQYHMIDTDAQENLMSKGTIFKGMLTRILIYSSDLGPARNVKFVKRIGSIDIAQIYGRSHFPFTTSLPFLYNPEVIRLVRIDLIPSEKLRNVNDFESTATSMLTSLLSNHAGIRSAAD